VALSAKAVEASKVDEIIIAGRFIVFPDRSSLARIFTPRLVHFGTRTEPISADGAPCSKELLIKDNVEHVQSPERLRLTRKSPEASVAINRFQCPGKNFS
jgi:hypothetical protein